MLLRQRSTHKINKTLVFVFTRPPETFLQFFLQESKIIDLDKLIKCMLFLFLRNFSYQKFWMKFNSSFFLTEKKISYAIFRMKGKKIDYAYFHQSCY